MEAVRSGLCHGPECDRRISERSPSEDFCSERCAARWNGRWDVTAERVWQAQHREDGTLWTVSAVVPWTYERAEPRAPMVNSLAQRGQLKTVGESARSCSCGYTAHLDGLRRLHEADHAAEERHESALPWWRRLLGWLR